MSLHIVIADDKQDIQDSIEQAVKKHYPETSFKGFLDIIELIEYLSGDEIKVDLLILDNDFGIGLTGAEQLPAIRELLPVAPILFLTGEEKLDVIRTTTPYDVDYILKPIGEAELISRIDKHIYKIQQWKAKVADWKKKINEIKNADTMNHLPYEAFEKLEHEDDLQNILNNLYDYSKSMIANMEDSQKTLYREKKKDLQKRYNGLDDSALDFFATSDYLFLVHKNSNMDYSAIAIGYCKGIEILLNNFLERNNKSRKRMMLGEAICLIENAKLLDSRKVADLKTVCRVRNRAAHTDPVSKDMVGNLQAILFWEKDMVKYLETL